MNRLPISILVRVAGRFARRFGLEVPPDLRSLDDLLVWGTEQVIPWDEILDTIFGPEEAESPIAEDPTAPTEADNGSPDGPGCGPSAS